MLVQFKDICKPVQIRLYFLDVVMTCFVSQRDSQKYLILDSSREDDW